MRNQSSTLKTSCDVFFSYSLVVCTVVCEKKFDLADVLDIRSHKRVNFVAVRAFQWTKNTDIERLGHVRRVRRKTNRNNVVLRAVFLESCRDMALVLIEYKHTLYADSTRPSMLIEVFKPI